MHQEHMGVEVKDEDEWIDFSSLSTFMDCPRKYFWNVKNHIKSADSTALQFGSSIHAALASWHIDKDDEKANQIFIEAVKVIIKDDIKRNAHVGLSILHDYYERWRIENYQTIQTEIGFAVDMEYYDYFEDCIKPFFFIGKVDRYINTPFGKMIMETKTTSIAGDRWLMRGKPNLQIDGYVSAISIITGENIVGGILDIIHVHEDSKKRKAIGRVITMRTKEDIDLWAKNVSEWYSQIALCNASHFFPMNSNTCVPLVGYTCNYLPLCQKYPFPPKNNIELPDDFIINEWHPYKKEIEK